MPAFEPSTWAEVEEAAASHKSSAQIADVFVTRVRAFTAAPERFLTSSGSGLGPGSDISQRAARSIQTIGTDVLSDRTAPSEPSILETDHSTAQPTDPDNPDLAWLPNEAHSVDSPPRVSREKLLRPPLSRVKRNTHQFDDLLALGRVDIDSQSIVRRFTGRTNVEQLVMFPAQSKEKRLRQSPVNPSSAAFDPEVYLSKIHKFSTVDQLTHGKANLMKLRTKLDEQADAFRREKFVSAALVESAFERTKKALEPWSPFAERSNGADTEQVFDGAQAMLRARYEDVLCREMKLTRLQRTLDIFAKHQWVFALGSRLRSAATEGLDSIEEAVTEYKKGISWLEVQGKKAMEYVEKDIDHGFNVLVDSLLNRLSTGHLSRQETTRLVAVLTSVRREHVLGEALSRRMSFATEGLLKSSRTVPVSGILSRVTTKNENDITELIARASSSFFDGLTHFWRLGRVLMGQSRWVNTVETHLVEFCTAFSNVLKEHLLSDVNLITTQAVKLIAIVKKRATEDLQISRSYLGPLVETYGEVVDCFLRSISGAVRNSAEHIASQAVQNNTVGAQSAQLLQAVITEALSQIDSAFLPGFTRDISEEKTSQTSLGKSIIYPDAEKTADAEREPSGFDLLGKACAEVPAIFAEEIYTLMLQDGGEKQQLSALKVAICCTELLGSVMETIAMKTESSNAYDRSSIQSYLSSSDSSIREVRAKAMKEYVGQVSKPLQTLAGGLVSFPDEELEDSVSRTVPIKIEGVSKGANELTLQLALLTISARKTSGSVELIRSILIELVTSIGQAFVQVLSTDKLVYHRAAQLWVDVTYVEEMITSGAESSMDGLKMALEGYSRVRERAVQAVLADGYSFSAADMASLQESVIKSAIEDSRMVQSCFAETWTQLIESVPASDT